MADIDKEEAKSLLHRLRPIATAGGIKPEGISPQEVAQHFARWTLSDMSDALALFRAANAKTIHPDDATVMSKTIPGMTPEKRELSTHVWRWSLRLQTAWVR